VLVSVLLTTPPKEDGQGRRSPAPARARLDIYAARLGAGHPDAAHSRRALAAVVAELSQQRSL
jgi:hypothetical protein